MGVSHDELLPWLVLTLRAADRRCTFSSPFYTDKIIAIATRFLTAERRERSVHPLRDLGADGVIDEHCGAVPAPAQVIVDAPLVKSDKRPRPIFLDPYRAAAH